MRWTYQILRAQHDALGRDPDPEIVGQIERIEAPVEFRGEEARAKVRQLRRLAQEVTATQRVSDMRTHNNVVAR